MRNSGGLPSRVEGSRSLYVTVYLSIATKLAIACFLMYLALSLVDVTI